MPRKIIIDTDPGVDDTMAIFFALRSPELKLVGLTTIFGNVHTDLATTNALRLLEIAERTDIPVTWPALHTGTGLLPAWQGRPLVNVCVDVDAGRVVALELSRLT